MQLTDEELKLLRQQMDKQAIGQVVYRLARAIDRCDKTLLATCFHEGATDDHGIFKGTAVEFGDWVMEELKKYQRTQHFIANLNIEVNGPAAAGEAYFLAHHWIESDDGLQEVVAAGRYLARFEKRSGVWRIIHRHAVYDWNQAQPTQDLWSAAPVRDAMTRGARGRADASYDHFDRVLNP